MEAEEVRQQLKRAQMEREEAEKITARHQHNLSEMRQVLSVLRTKPLSTLREARDETLQTLLTLQVHQVLFVLRQT